MIRDNKAQAQGWDSGARVQERELKDGSQFCRGFHFPVSCLSAHWQMAGMREQAGNFCGQSRAVSKALPPALGSSLGTESGKGEYLRTDQPGSRDPRY